jgi:DNA-binding MarR family transcriptional regulator
MSTVESRQDPAPRLAELFHSFGRLHARWMQSVIESTGVSPARIRLLGVLHCKGPQIMCSLGDELGVTARNVTTLVDALEGEGMVRRTAHPSDRRATVVELTPVGVERSHQVLGPFWETVAGLYRDLPEPDQRELVRLMETLLGALRGRCDGEPGG